MVKLICTDTLPLTISILEPFCRDSILCIAIYTSLYMQLVDKVSHQIASYIFVTHAVDHVFVELLFFAFVFDYQIQIIIVPIKKKLIMNLFKPLWL